MKKQIEKWKKKSLFGKITDFVFIALIIALLIPQSRLEIGAFVNRVKASFMQPSVVEDADAQKLSSADYDWTIVGTDNKALNLSDFEGKVLFINMWATWCPPCVGEMPEIQELYDSMKDLPDVEFLMVSNESVEKISKFKKERGYSFPVYSMRSAPSEKMKYTVLPTTFIIGKDGKIAVREEGAANWGSEKTQKLILSLTEK